MVKYEEVHLKTYQDGRDARYSLSRYFHFYNAEHPHQAYSYETIGKIFDSIRVEATTRGMLKSFIPDPLRIARPTLNIPCILSQDGGSTIITYIMII